MNPTPTNLPLVPHYGAYNNQYYANYNLSQQVATFPSAEEPQASTANHYENPSPSVESSHAEVATTTNEDIPADIIASQERALAAIRKQQPTAPRNSESSRALTVPFQSSYTSNPSGSVSIHPNRMDFGMHTSVGSSTTMHTNHTTRKMPTTRNTQNAYQALNTLNAY